MRLGVRRFGRDDSTPTTIVARHRGPVQARLPKKLRRLVTADLTAPCDRAAQTARDFTRPAVQRWRAETLFTGCL
jgi:hypothetical protein